MGYAKPGQDTSGIHFRLYSRAFVIADQNARVCVVNTDVAMISQVAKLEVSYYHRIDIPSKQMNQHSHTCYNFFLLIVFNDLGC